MGRYDYAARTRMLEFATANGWEKDPTAQRPGAGFGRQMEQDPYAFMKAADNGGSWRIKLDYRERGGSWSTSYGNLLQQVGITYVDANGERPFLKTVGWEHFPDFILSRPGRYDLYNGLWAALGSGKPDRSLPKRAELFLKDPDLAMWLGAEKNHEEQLLLDEHKKLKDAEYELRARPLPITVPKSVKWTSDEVSFDKLADKLVEAAKAIEDANGKSDLPKLMADMELAYDAVVNVLTEEAAHEVDTHLLHEEVNA